MPVSVQSGLEKMTRAQGPQQTDPPKVLQEHQATHERNSVLWKHPSNLLSMQRWEMGGMQNSMHTGLQVTTQIC